MSDVKFSFYVITLNQERNDKTNTKYIFDQFFKDVIDFDYCLVFDFDDRCILVLHTNYNIVPDCNSSCISTIMTYLPTLLSSDSCTLAFSPTNNEHILERIDELLVKYYDKYNKIPIMIGNVDSIMNKHIIDFPLVMEYNKSGLCGGVDMNNQTSDITNMD